MGPVGAHMGAIGIPNRLNGPVGAPSSPIGAPLEAVGIPMQPVRAATPVLASLSDGAPLPSGEVLGFIVRPPDQRSIPDPVHKKLSGEWDMVSLSPKSTRVSERGDHEGSDEYSSDDEENPRPLDGNTDGQMRTPLSDGNTGGREEDVREDHVPRLRGPL